MKKHKTFKGNLESEGVFKDMEGIFELEIEQLKNKEEGIENK